jgi:sugar (glycoside-pentoside-hexuronide) transporter
MTDHDRLPQIVPLRERLSFSTALFGQNMMYNLVNFFIMIFYTDQLGIPAAAAGTLFLVARVWDAANDLIMGFIVDRTRSRWGKCRPYLLFMSVPIAVATSLLFVVPDLSTGGKLIYAYVTYILWGMLYTTADIPLWSLSSRMTNDSDQRKILISFGRVFSTIGAVLPVVLVIPLKNAFGRGNNTWGYLGAAVLFCVIAAPMMMQAFANTVERAGSAGEDRPTLKENVRAIAANSPLLLVLLSGLLGVLTFLPMTGVMYFSTYNLGNEQYTMVLAGLNLCSMALGSAAVPLFSRWFTGRQIFIGTMSIAAVIGIIFFFIGYENLILVFVFTFILGFFWGFSQVLRTSMLADTIEYMQLKTGKRSEGAIFSTLTFLSKINIGLNNFITGLVLTFSGYVPNAVQSPGSLTGILMLVTLLPGIGSILTALPIFFYTLSEKEHRSITEQIG